MEPTYDVAKEEDLPTLARSVALAFAGTVDGTTEWLRTAGLADVRVLREGGLPVASLRLVPMGQFFGGRTVRMLGIAGVAVAPEARGRGLARRLMREALGEARASGWPISCLYASTQTLYRQVGYEQAGHRFLVRLPLSQIDVRERATPVTPLSEAQEAEVEACYRAFAATQDGWLDRGPYAWTRVKQVRDQVFHGFGVVADGRLDGYVYLTQRRKPETGRHDVLLSDVAFRTPEAGRRLLGFLADFGTVGDDLVFFGGPHHPLLWLLGQQRYSVTLRDYWMIRLIDVAGAVESRGYAPSVRAEVSIELTDELLDANAGRHVLSVADGRGRLEPGGSGAVRSSVRSLAALWSGFSTPAQLRLVGAMEGPEDAIGALGAIFAGGTPAMTDMF